METADGIWTYWRTQRGARSTFVYLITEQDSATGYAKIGRAGDPRKRLDSLQTGNPRELTLSGLILGGERAERALHRRWTHFRAHGEWFGGEDCLTYLQLAFAEIDRAQRELPPDLPLPEYDLVVERVCAHDFANPVTVCSGTHTCPCPTCELERAKRAKRGIRQRKQQPHIPRPAR